MKTSIKKLLGSVTFSAVLAFGAFTQTHSSTSKPNISPPPETGVRIIHTESETAMSEITIQRTESQTNMKSGRSDTADVNLYQGEPVIKVVDYHADQAGRMATDADRRSYLAYVAANPISQMWINQLINLKVVSEGGEDVGRIDYVGVRGEIVVVIIGMGGFLGLGEKKVAMPIDRLRVRDGVVYLPFISEMQLDRLPKYQETEVMLPEYDSLVIDLLGR